MEIKYISTRGAKNQLTASQAILKGLADDSGLYIPTTFPTLDKALNELIQLDYKELAYEILKIFLTDYTEEELRQCINKAYDDKFDTPAIAPLVNLGDVNILELYHGKTIAFKDMALSILPHLLKTAAVKNQTDKQIVILTATSGDTGKAALEGFANVPGTQIIVFYPEEGVSEIQKLQMTTQEGNNTLVVAIKGNFDDAQTAVKKIFNNETFKATLSEKNITLSSANSINIGRLIPQIVYYYSAYSQLTKQREIKSGEKINFIVPTGNFGNILAGYYAKKIGLPINKLICASNDNKVLYDFFKTGIYDSNREFILTASPSMDILISSNLERLIYHLSNEIKTKQLMDDLNKTGSYTFENKTNEIYGEYATGKEAKQGIKELFKTKNYLIDTHTAVAYAAYKKYKNETKDETKTIILATASPYKFAKDVLEAIEPQYTNNNTFQYINELSKKSNTQIPAPIKNLNEKTILHKTTCEKNEAQQTIEKYLKI